MNHSDKIYEFKQVMDRLVPALLKEEQIHEGKNVNKLLSNLKISRDEFLMVQKISIEALLQ